MVDFFSIVLENFMFWVNFIIVLAISGFMFIANKREYILKEFLVQIFGTFVILFAAYSIIFSTTTDLLKQEYWGGKVTSATYEEPWTEEYSCDEQVCSGSGENRTCRTVRKTCTTRHSENYFLTTSNGTNLSITERNWRQFKNDFSAIEIDKRRSGQTYTSKLSGEGDIWVSSPTINIPTAEEHNYVNYITASKMTIHKKFQSELSETDKKNIVNYPTIQQSKYGGIKLDRIMGNISPEIEKKLQKGLDDLSIKYASEKQANLLLYMLKDTTNDMGRKILSSISFNKNDLIIFINESGGKITWSEGGNFLGGEEYMIAAQKDFIDINISDTDKILKVYEDILVNKWNRKSMEEYKYLKGDIEIALQWQLLVIFLNGIFNFFVFRYFLRN